MAEFLVMAYPPETADKSNPQRYQRGDIVEIYEDGRCKEPPSPNSCFIAVCVPGIKKEEAQKLLDGHYVDTGIVHPLGDRVFRMENRRRYFLRIDDLDSKSKSELETRRMILMSGKDFDAYLRDKVEKTDGTWR